MVQLHSKSPVAERTGSVDLPVHAAVYTNRNNALGTIRGLKLCRSMKSPVVQAALDWALSPPVKVCQKIQAAQQVMLEAWPCLPEQPVVRRLRELQRVRAATPPREK